MLRTLSRSEIAERRTRRVSVLMLIVLSVLLLAACENGWIRAKGERGALTYYQNKYGVEVDVVSVEVTPIACRVATVGDDGAGLLFQVAGVVYQLQAVFQSPLALDEHEVLPVEADEEGCAVPDEAFAFGKLVEGDGLRHAAE